jgi:hypothetical protein
MKDTDGAETNHLKNRRLQLQLKPASDEPGELNHLAQFPQPFLQCMVNLR